jgi:hypothetical protein
MKPTQARELQARFRAQHGLVTRAELRALGMTSRLERQQIESGEWELVGPTVVRLSGAPRTPEQDLLAACLWAGPSAVASHQSAAWLWGLWDFPRRHATTVARGVSARPRGADVHRPREPPAHVVMHRGIPCTNPLRSLVDLAAVVTEDGLDGAIDRAVASRLLAAEGIEAEVIRLSRHGRPGVGVMRAALRRRGFTGAPHPSVLESRTLRLLRRFGIEPLGTEVRMGPGGRYRVDILLAPNVVMEVDGFAYHSDPEQMAEDKRRRTQIRLGGNVLLEYTWRDIVYDAHRVAREVHLVLAEAGPGGTAGWRLRQMAD